MEPKPKKERKSVPPAKETTSDTDNKVVVGDGLGAETPKPTPDAVADKPKEGPVQALPKTSIEQFMEAHPKDLEKLALLGEAGPFLVQWFVRAERAIVKLAENQDVIAQSFKQGSGSAATPTPGAGGVPMGDVVKIITEALKGGGGEDPFWTEMKKQFMAAGMDSFMTTSRLGKIVLEKTAQQIGANVADKVIEGVK